MLGVVVEVEAYAAIDDEAAHTFTRPSARIYRAKQSRRCLCLFQLWRSLDVNVLVKGGENGFVLIRALEPRQGTN